MKTIKVYVAGKISKESVFKTHSWRDDFCKELSAKSGFEIVNLDTTKADEDFDFDQGNPELIVGRNCFMIQKADLVIAYLSDDISVGGSQEMLIAKYFKRPLLGIAPKNGKFNASEKEVLGRTYKDYIDPFVAVSCDAVVADIDEAARFIKEFFSREARKAKGLHILDDATRYYLKQFYPSDRMLH